LGSGPGVQGVSEQDPSLRAWPSRTESGAGAGKIGPPRFPSPCPPRRKARYRTDPEFSPPGTTRPTEVAGRTLHVTEQTVRAGRRPEQPLHTRNRFFLRTFSCLFVLPMLLRVGCVWRGDTHPLLGW